MTLELTAYLERASVPDRAALQAAIAALGFDCRLDASYNPLKPASFLPCLLEGRKTGIEIAYASVADHLEISPDLAHVIQSRDVAMEFRWGSRVDDATCALIVCAALAAQFGAVVHSPDEDLWYSPTELRSEASDSLKFA